jgi:hypothetical protein
MVDGVVAMNMATRIVSFMVVGKMPMMVAGIVQMMMRALPQMMMRSSRLGTICEREKNANHDKQSKHNARPKL